MLADGWAPFGVGPAEVATWLDAARDLPSSPDRSESMEVVLQTPKPLDPSAAPSATVEALGELGEAGATIVDVRLIQHSADHCIEQLEALMELIKG